MRRGRLTSPQRGLAGLWAGGIEDKSLARRAQAPQPLSPLGQNLSHTLRLPLRSCGLPKPQFPQPFEPYGGLEKKQYSKYRALNAGEQGSKAAISQSRVKAAVPPCLSDLPRAV